MNMKAAWGLVVLATVALGQQFFDLEESTELQCRPGEIIGFSITSDSTTGMKWFLIPSGSSSVQHLNGVMGSTDGLPGSSTEVQKFLVRCSEMATGYEIIQFILVRRSSDDMSPKDQKVIVLRIIK